MSLIQKLINRDELQTQALLDPVSKFRVSTPQTLIDTDFEYSLQPTKWESIEMINNIPVFFTRDGDEQIELVDVQITEASYNIVITSRFNHNFVVGTPFIISGLLSASAEGTFVVNNIISLTQFSYRAKRIQTETKTIFDSYTSYLYSAKFFQSTQYTYDNLIAIETSGLARDDDSTIDISYSDFTNTEKSTIKVITKSPSGFLKDSFLILSNSFGIKSVDFDASTVDIYPTIITSYTIDTASNNPSGSGYLSRVMNPYNFESKQTYYVGLEDVNISNNSITASNHGLRNDNFVMYVSPLSDKAIGGLSNYCLYKVANPTTHTFQLQNVEPYQRSGFQYRLFGLNIGTIVRSGSSPNFIYNPSGNPYTYANNTASLLRYTGFGGSTYITSMPITSSTSLGGTFFNNASPGRSLEMFGYYYARTTSLYSFKLIATNAFGYMWFGSNATIEYNSVNTAYRGGAVGFGTNYPTTGYPTTSPEVSIQLQQGQYLPIRLHFSSIKTASVDLRLQIKDPLVAGYPSTFTNFSTSLHPVYTYTPRLNTAGTVQESSGGYWYQFTNLTLGEGATSNYGIHSFHKSFPINYINKYPTNSINVMYRQLDSQGTSAVVLKKDLSVTLFSRDYLRGEGIGLNGPNLTYNNYGDTCMLSTYNKAAINYRLSATYIPPNSTSTTLNINLSGNPVTNYLYDLNLGLVNWIVPTAELSLRDSFYYKNHGIAANNLIRITSATGEGMPGGISLLTDYYAEVLGTDYFRLKPTIGSPAVDITNFKNSSLTLTRITSNANAYSIYAPGHDLIEGTYVKYTKNKTTNTLLTGLTDNGFYYIRTPTSTRFKLSLSKGGAIQSITNNPSLPEAHSIISQDRATDGNYRIDTIDGNYGMVLQGLTGIPRIPFTFLPNKVLDLEKQAFKLVSHDLVTGARLIYKKPTDYDEINGLTDNQSYFIIRLDADYFRLSKVTIDDTIVTADGYIALYNQINSNNYIEFSTYPLNTYSCNHTFQIITIGGQTKTNNVLTLTHSCNIVRCDSVDFFSTTRLGDFLNIHYNERQTSYTIRTSPNDGVQVGADLPSTNVIIFNANHNLISGNSVVYKQGTNYIRGLSNDNIYYVNSNALNTISLYYSSNAALQQSIDSTYYTGGIDGRIQLGMTGIATSTVGNFIRYQEGLIQQYQIKDINNKNYVTLENNISLPSYLGIGTTASGNALLLSTGLYPRSDSYIEHRAYNGGVEIVPSLNPDSVIIRQTRRYFRYQSGKGIQLSKAVNFSAPVEIISMVRGDPPATLGGEDGSYVTVTTRKPHRLAKGVQIEIRGVDIGDNDPDNDIWNQTYVVYEIDSESPTIFYFALTTLPRTTEAGGFPNYIVSRTKWGSYLRAGLMDDQNGIFFEFDGEKLYCCRRNSVTQIPGTVNCVFNSQLITGVNTRFTTQIAQAGSKPELGRDRIVIRGVTYKIILVQNDETLYIQPPYRGITGSSLIMSLTQDTKTPQEEWSIDACDGNGPTGFNLDINKIQMVYIDYSWYGAGKVRYGFKTLTGEVRYVHDFIHNNQFTLAYLRSGNLPARYEVGTLEEPIFAPALLHWGTSVIMDGGFDDDAAYIFTAAGKQIIYFNRDTTDYNLAASGRVFTVTYAGATTTHFDGTLNRDVISYIVTLAGANLATVIFNELRYFVPGTEIWDQTALTFFGSQNRITAYAELIDGVYYMYVANAPSFIGTRSSGTLRLGSKLSDPIPRNIPLISIRLAPSVDNGKGAQLGQREIINRMQLDMFSVGVLSTHDCEIKIILNGVPFSKNYDRITSPSLAQAIYHEKFASISGGLAIYSFRITGGSIDTTLGATKPRRLAANTSIQLDQISSLGNSIIAGNGIFPDGPDLVTVVATPLDTNYVGADRPFSITSRISWKEAQA